MAPYTPHDFLVMRIHKEARAAYRAHGADAQVVRARQHHEGATERWRAQHSRMWREAKAAGRGYICARELDSAWRERRVAARTYRNALVQWYVRARASDWKNFRARLHVIGYTEGQLEWAAQRTAV